MAQSDSPSKPKIFREIAEGRRSRSHRLTRIRESFIIGGLSGSAIFSIFITATILGVLGWSTVTFFLRDEVTLWEFILSTQWNPLMGGEKHFGVWPLISGTMLVTVIAMAIAMPLGLITAIYMSEYAPPRVRSVIKPTLEVLAGIPTVVYGFFALVFLTPAMNWITGGIFSIYNAGSAGIAVGVLCLPIVSSLCEDALRAVPGGLRDGAYGLGATKFDVSAKVVLPAALSGIISAFLLAFARAVGETMIVALAAGTNANLTANPTESIMTMTGWMVKMAKGDVSNFQTEYYSMYAVAATLFVITFSLTVFGSIIRRRYREVYN